MPSIFFERRSLLHEGIRLSYDGGDGVAKPIAHINGNDTTFRGPVVLLSVDAHVVYGLSHPQVISTILKEGPQTMVASKEMAHHLYEHGMKAAVGKQRMGNNVFQASLDTYYRVMLNLGGDLSVVPGAALLYKTPCGAQIICVTGSQTVVDRTSGQILVELHRIQDYHKIDLPQ